MGFLDNLKKITAIKKIKKILNLTKKEPTSEKIQDIKETKVSQPKGAKQKIRDWKVAQEEKVKKWVAEQQPVKEFRKDVAKKFLDMYKDKYPPKENVQRPLERISEIPALKYCPVCGAEVKSGARYCWNCGARLD